MKHPFAPLVALLLTLATADARPHMEGSPWHMWASAWQLARPAHLAPALLCLFLAGVPLERRLGLGAFLAAWVAPHLVLLPLLHTSWAELSAVSLLVALLTVSRAESPRGPHPWKLWVPLGLAVLCTLPSAGIGLGPALTAGATGVAVGWGSWKAREAVNTLGWAAGALIGLGWLS